MLALSPHDPRSQGNIGRYNTTPIWLRGDSRPVISHRTVVHNPSHRDERYFLSSDP